jgi:DNA polymerase
VTDEELRRELTLLRDLGYTHLDVGELRAQEPEARAPEPPVRAATPAPPAAGGGAPDTHTIIASDDLGDLAAIAAPCTRCRLAATRTQVVFGTGNPSADLMFVGEAPGRDEDIKGEPFVGRAGQLLTDIIKAMKLIRDDVYIANVIKCRPPENRNPEPDELDACRPYIRKQIELIKPKVIVVLGRFALQSLTEKAYSISSVRGTWLAHDGIKVMPTYHPAYLLRNPGAKKEVWQDMKKVMTELGIQ